MMISVLSKLIKRALMQRPGLTDERLFELAKEFDAIKSHPPAVKSL